MHNSELKNIVHALLMASDEPLTVENLREVFEPWEKPSIDDVKAVLSALTEAHADSGVELKSGARGYAFQTSSRYSTWISRLWRERPPKYSNALLETLAIIAYRQPVTRADIETIRGVATSSAMIKTLVEREWIRIASYRDVPGKPAVYTTTNAFLDYFNVVSLNELPPLVSSEQSE